MYISLDWVGEEEETLDLEGNTEKCNNGPTEDELQEGWWICQLCLMADKYVFSLDGAALEMNKRRQTFKITTWRAATDRWRRSFKEGDEVWERHRLAGGEPSSIVCEPSLCFAPDGGWP
jgi:hypothetical protein